MEVAQRLAQMQGRILEWRRQRASSHEAGHHPQSLESWENEGGAVAQYLPEGEGTEIVTFFDRPVPPISPDAAECLDMRIFDAPDPFENPPDYTPKPPLPSPFVAGSELSRLQRRQSRRITKSGKR